MGAAQRVAVEVEVVGVVEVVVEVVVVEVVEVVEVAVAEVGAAEVGAAEVVSTDQSSRLLFEGYHCHTAGLWQKHPYNGTGHLSTHPVPANQTRDSH